MPANQTWLFQRMNPFENMIGIAGHRLPVLNRLFGKKTKAFNLNATREEQRDWFAHTPPWNGIASNVVEAILDGITDKVLLGAFVAASMENDLVARYEPLGREGSDSTVICAQISHILCQTGHRALTSLVKALEAKEMQAAAKAACLAQNTLESAIALANYQIVAYAGLAVMYGMTGKLAQCHDYAKRGLAELAEMRCLNPPMPKNAAIPANALDQVERQLRRYLKISRPDEAGA
jgi:hypothetical protein